MMARTRFSGEGLDDYIQTLNRLSDNAEEIVKRAVYEGANIIADKVRENIRNLPIDERYGTPEDPLYGITRVQKEGLLDGFGVAPMDDVGDNINTLIGFDDAGYNRNGQANRMIARAVQSGTTFSKKIPFFNNAVRQSRPQAIEKMKQTLEEEIERLTR